MDNKNYLLAFNRMYGIGPRIITKLLQRWPQLDELFHLSQKQMLEAGLPPLLANAISTFDLTIIEEDLAWQMQEGCYLLTWYDEDYPALLKQIYDPPPVLYAEGDLSSFHQPMIAVVGSRKPTPTGAETAWQFAFELASEHITIVSGLALGIDAQAHGGSLKAGGKTIAVMGSGIDLIYPHRHLKMAEKIRENGLLLSEFPLKMAPSAGHFPRRNRIISGLSLATLVVEAAVKSGSLITARLACEQNRDVFAIPGSIYNPQARGCHYLLQQGAKLVTSSQDVLEELNLGHAIKKDKLGCTLASENENLVKCIGFETTTIVQIIARSGFTVEKVMCDLAELELQGVIRAVSGGYMRCGI